MVDTMTLEEVRGQLSSWFGGSEACVDVKACDRLGEMINALDAAIEQREQDAKGAARYRWLRDMRNREQAAMLVSFKMNLDAAIDAAMAEESGNE